MSELASILKKFVVLLRLSVLCTDESFVLDSCEGNRFLQREGQGIGYELAGIGKGCTRQEYTVAHCGRK